MLIVKGRLEVDRIIGKKAAQNIFAYEVWDAADHVVDTQGTGTVIRFDVAVSAKVTAGLRLTHRGRTFATKACWPKTAG